MHVLHERGALARRATDDARRRPFPRRAPDAPGPRSWSSPSPTARTRPASCSASRRVSPTEIDGHVVAITRRGARARACSPRGAPTRSCTSTARNVEEDVAARSRRLGASVGAVGDHHRLDRVGPRGRVARRRRGSTPGSPATRSTSRSATGGSSRGSPRSAASSSPRSARRRAIQMATVRAGMLTAPAPRAGDRRAAPCSRMTTYPTRAACACSPARATTISTRSPRPRVVIGVGRGRRARRVRRARAAARRCSAPSSARPARSPTKAGSRAPARSASPAARSRRASS